MSHIMLTAMTIRFAPFVPFRRVEQVAACKKRIQFQPSEITYSLYADGCNSKEMQPPTFRFSKLFLVSR